MGQKWKRIALWALIVLMATFFLMAGAAKLTGSASQTTRFVQWGYPSWFLYVVGLVEAGGAVGLLVPRLSGFSALVLSLTMVGAFMTHLVHAEWSALPVPLVLIGLLTPIAYARRDSFPVRGLHLLTWP